MGATTTADRLGTAALIGIVVGSTTPQTVVAGVFPTALATIEVPSLAPVVVLVAVVLAVFSAGYVAMARDLRTSGALHAFAARGLAPWVGGGAAWIAIVSYFLLQVGLYGAIGAAVEPLLPGAAPPWWVVAGVAWLVVAVLGALRITVSTNVVKVLLAIELVATAAAAVVLLLRPGPSGSITSGLDAGVLVSPALGPVLGVVLLAFLGFEQAAVYAPEARDGVRSVRIATVSGLAVVTVLYVGAALAYSSALGPDLPAAAAQSGPQLWFSLIDAHVPALAVANQVMFAVALFVGALTFHNTTARYVNTLASERLLASGLAGVDRRARRNASLAVSALGAVVLVVVAVTGADPVQTLFFLGATTGGVGLLTVLTVVSPAVCRHLVRASAGAGRVALSVVAVLGMVGIWATVVLHLDSLLGAVLAAAPAVAVVGFAVVAVGGIARAVWLRRHHPGDYARIGDPHGT